MFPHPLLPSAMKTFSIILVLCFSASLFGWAQPKTGKFTLTGTVIDSIFKEPCVAGLKIGNSGLTNYTDIEGKYKIVCDSSDSDSAVHVSSIGYISKTFKMRDLVYPLCTINLQDEPSDSIIMCYFVDHSTIRLDTLDPMFEYPRWHYGRSSIDMFSQFATPNPSKGVLRIRPTDLKDDEPYQVFVYGSNGQMLKSLTLTGLDQSLDLSELPKGSYLIKLEQQDFRLKQRVVIE